MVGQSSVIVKNNLPKIIAGLNKWQTSKLGAAIGARLETALVERIHTGDPGWAPLSAAWAEQKGHGNQWYYTGTLESAIKYEVRDEAVYVGIVKPEGEVGQIAMQLEYGTSKIPARPLFGPVASENEDEIVKIATEWIKAQIALGKI